MFKYLFLFLISSQAMAQDTLISLPVKDGKVYYERIYSDSASKEALFLKAKDVFIRLFPDSKSVIQDEDKEAGMITGKGYFSFSVRGGALNLSFQQMARCTFRLTVKDGKCRVEIFDLYSEGTDEYPIEVGYAITSQKRKKKWYPYYEALDKRIHELFDQIEHTMDQKNDF